jgi:hypothetical protein
MSTDHGFKMTSIALIDNAFWLFSEPCNPNRLTKQSRNDYALIYTAHSSLLWHDDIYTAHSGLLWHDDILIYTAHSGLLWHDDILICFKVINILDDLLIDMWLIQFRKTILCLHDYKSVREMHLDIP